MNKKLPFKFWILATLLVLNVAQNFAQEIVPLAERVSMDNVHGDLTMIGNTVVGLVDSFSDDIVYDPNAAYNGDLNNGSSISDYIDIDGDVSTFSSSSADLVTPNPDCTTIAYAGLYWAATYYLEREEVTENVFTINTPAAIAGNYSFNDNTFDPGHIDIPADPGITASLVLVDDNVDTFEDGCTALVNTAELNGNIAILRRGSCSFTQKVLNAQNAGAIAVIIVNNQNGNFTLAGGDAAITIPAISMNKVDGDAIIAELNNGPVNATLKSEIQQGNEQLTDLPLLDARKTGDADFRKLKFKVPGGSYTDVTAESVIYDGYRNTPTNPSDVAADDVPYVCYANVTNLFNQSNTNGTYTVANMNATIGTTSGISGPVAGWTLVIVYEDAQLPQKFISTNDGFVQIRNSDPPVDFIHTGFTTLPAPVPVNAKFGISSLEGDKGLLQDKLQIRNTSDIYIDLGDGVNNPTSNFFNSSITNNGAFTTNRNPSSQNTLGFDIDIFDLPNSANSLIGNNQNSANFRLQTFQDTFRAFLTAFAIEIIEPELSIVKRVYAVDGITEITDGTLDLGDELFYDLEIENTGNENLLDGSVVVSDYVPDNVDVVNVVDATLPSGVTYDLTTPGKIIFSIPAAIVESQDGPIFIRYRGALVNSCEELRDSCSDRVESAATVSYTGEFSGIAVTGGISSSAVDSCGEGNSETTGFSINVPACSTDVSLCGGNLILTAGSGYNQYVWSGPNSFSTTTSVNFVEVPNAVSGTYSVVKNDTNPGDGTCASRTEEFEVSSIGDINNPILDYVNGTSVITENCNGLDIPQILLCGGQTLLLETNFDPASLISISWQRLTPSGACVVDANDPCSLLSGDCTTTNWIEEIEGNTQSFTVDAAGDYRILAEFEGSCIVPFYFSAFMNDYQPELTMSPIECGNDGNIEVTNAPANFAFGLVQGGPYDNSTGIFTIAPGSGGDITVYAIDTTLPNCEYTVTINVPEIDPVFNITATNPTCVNDNNGDGFGRITITVTDGLPEYQYTISGGDLVSPIVVPNSAANNGNYTQEGLVPGTYDVEIISNRPDSSCTYTETVTIDPAASFAAEVVLISPETCDSGAMVQVNVISGPGDYVYDNGSGVFQANNVFEIPRPADPNTTYTFFVTDNNVPAGIPACILDESITGIASYQPTLIDDITTINPACTADGGEIRVQVSPAVAGRTYAYRLVDAINNNPVDEINSTARDITFTNIGDGSYKVEVLHNNTTNPSGDPICNVSSGESYTIIAPSPISFNASVSRELSCITGNEDAIITIDNITGGSGSYAWSFNPSTGYTIVTNQPYDISVSTAGNYSLFIRNQDTGDCTVEVPLTINPLEEIDDIQFVNGAIDCGNSTVGVTVDAIPALSGGVFYEYSVSPDPASNTGVTQFSTTNSYTFTSGITYTITARRSDNGCTYENSYSTNPINPIEITDISIQNATCNGSNDGAVQFTTNSTNFKYEITDPTGAFVTDGTSTTSPVNLSGLGVTTYTLTVIDLDTLCTYSEVFEIGSLGTLNTIVTRDTTAVNAGEISCVNPETIQVTITSGVGPFNFEEITGAVTGQFGIAVGTTTFSLPSAGTYTFRITDLATGCEVDTQSYIVNPFDTIDVQATVTTDVSCTGDSDGSITAEVSGYTGGYDYTVLNGGVGNTITNGTGNTSSGSIVVTGLASGTYVVSVVGTEAPFCEASLSITISEPSPITANITVIDPTIQEAGEIEIQATGGTPPYTYGLDGGALTTSNMFTDLAPAMYSVLVLDSNGCQETFNATLSPPVLDVLDITLDLRFAQANCYGDENASVNANVTGGTGTYSYTLTGTDFLGNTINLGPQPNSEYRDLGAGNYNYTVTSTGVDPLSIPFTISQPQEFSIVTQVTSITCNGSNDGGVRVEVNGGTPPYSYAISSNFGLFFSDTSDGILNQHTFEGLSAGDYEVLAQDAKGCSQLLSVVINGSAPIQVNVLNIIPETCSSDSDGMLSIEISGGTPPYLTNITNNDADFLLNKLNYSNLPAGTTTLYVVDNNGCRTSVPIEIPKGIHLGGILETSSECSTSLGSPTPVYEINVVLDNDSPTDVMYSLIGINGTPDPANTSNTSGVFVVIPGDYEGRLLHVSGCEVSLGTIVVEEYTEVNSIVEGNNPTNPGENGEIVVNITQGNGPFTITLDNETPIVIDDNTYIFTQVAAGNHQVIVSDNGECSFQSTVITIVEEDKNPIVNYAQEILVCAITGQSYPIVTIQDQEGEILDLPLLNVVSIVWQKLDEVTCDIELEDNCPTSDSVCTSDWFDIGTGNTNTFTEPGEYRVVVNFSTRSGNNEKIYYFRVESEIVNAGKEIVVFPNPARDRVRLNTEVEQVLIYDIMGKLVMKTNQNSYSVAGLRNGIYFVKIQTQDNREVIVKLLKE
ncbi:PA domain-containing protein [Aquimarina sp. AU474]|uniref:PA domain-containing protein n=1 Tax=Aquimarina sp. AU474 TaxID=2108529 RepID=UPI000D68EB70|nr:PA domain-containing protein [Aquimarina sp. AU474]